MDWHDKVCYYLLLLFIIINIVHGVRNRHEQTLINYELTYRK